jgi:hypothetical protein
VKRTYLAFAAHSVLSHLGLSPCTFSIDSDEGVELGIKPLYFCEVGFEQFNWGNFSLSDSVSQTSG